MICYNHITHIKIQNSTLILMILFLGYTNAVLVNPTCSPNGCEQEAKQNSWQCICLNVTDESEKILDCRCEGLSLNRVPQKLHVGLHKLTLFNCGLRMLRRRGLQPYSSTLMDIIITDMPYFEEIEGGAFSNIASLRTIYISHAPELHNISRHVFEGVSHTLKSLRIMYTGLDHVPDMNLMHGGNILHIIDFEGNRIKRIETEAFRVIAEQLILDHNPISWVSDHAFSGSQIGKLSFKGNKEIRQLQPKTFSGLLQIRELDLSYTSLEALPPEGLEGLEILRIENTPTLKVIPSIYHLKSLRQAHLTYAFHCCAFQYPARHDPILYAQRVAYIERARRFCDSAEGQALAEGNETNLDAFTISDFEIWNAIGRRQKRTIIHFDSEQTAKDHVMSNIKNSNHFLGQFSHTQNHINEKENDKNEAYKISNDFVIPEKSGESVSVWSSESSSSENGADSGMDFGVFHEMTTEIGVVGLTAICGNLTESSPPVRCKPKADALNPCEDVMGSSWLRISVWLVLLVTILGNIAVLVVSFFSGGEQSVSRFLMVHLALADLCMGLYLLLLACIDAHSMGEFFNYASDWQYGAGCKVAGFLTVFAAQLSIFSLSVLTVERWMAITRAIYLERRLDTKMAYRAMAFGWLFSLAAAILPLFGVNNYSSTSICLPMSTEDNAGMAYIVVLLVVNGLAFVLVALCYIQIYTSLGGGENGVRSEMHVAKKIALLVFIYFVCWAPIAFFAITAIAGKPLIDVSHSKILLVFFYPLNSCANPFLYAILTKQYKRDVMLMLIRHGIYKKKTRSRTTFSLQTLNNSNGLPLPLIQRPSGATPRNSEGPNQEESFL